MALQWGRWAGLFINGTLIGRQKDVDNPDEADDMKATARDLPYAVHGQGGKDTSITFQILDDGGESFQLLQDAFDNNTDDLEIVLVKDRRKATSPSRQFVGVVLKFSPSNPESGPSLYDVMIAPSDPDNLPSRNTWTNPDS